MSCNKKFKLMLPTSTTSQNKIETNWDLCVICQEDIAEELTCPLQSKRTDVGSGYTSLSQNLLKFGELGQLPRTLQLQRIDEGCGIESTMVARNAQYHQSCRLKYNNTMLKRAEKRKEQTGSESENTEHSTVHFRSRSSITENINHLCFFCRQIAGPEGLRQASTFKLDRRLRACALLLEDTDMLAKLSSGDVVALEVKYHAKCLTSYYNRARKVKAAESKDEERTRRISATVFAELVLYIEETRSEEDITPVFKLVDLGNMYVSRLEKLGIKLETRLNTTRLKERLLMQIPDIRAYNRGRDVLLGFEDDVGSAFDKACELDSDSDALHLARAAQVVRRHMFLESNSFTGFSNGCQEKSVPPLLLTLVQMVMEGPSIKDQMTDSTPAALAIAQLVKFNSVKHTRTPHSTNASTCSVRHQSSQETPLPIYMGLMLHTHTRKKKLIEKLSCFGLSISYDRVLRLSAQLGDTVCYQYHREQVVCPPKLRGSVFTTAAIDNIDHNCTSTTAKESFHGTSISLLQHPSFYGQGIDRSIVIEGLSDEASTKKSINRLPHFFTDVQPVTSNVKNVAIPHTAHDMPSLNREGFKEHKKQEYMWLDKVRQTLDEGDLMQTKADSTSWSAFHASQHTADARVVCPTALLPLFLESAHTVAMIRHSMDIVSNAVFHLNPGQTPVLTFDQPLFALAKQIQWMWPDTYGEQKMVVMFGGLHIEMAALKTLGDLLHGSGWVEAIVQAEIATPGAADAFLRAAHVTRTRRTHQITAAALFILRRQAYDRWYDKHEGDGLDVDFEEWCNLRKQAHPQFHYWATVLELELLLLVYVRSLRLASFPMYLDALTELAPWFHVFDHTHYARWITIHLRDMAKLATEHPDVAAQFNAGNFTVQKTRKLFSSIPIDQAHEQNNALIKEDGGAVGLTDNPSALRRWMVAGPEIATFIESFEEDINSKVDTCHHDQTASVQVAFVKDVRSLVDVIDKLGNPFEEESGELLTLNTKEFAGPLAVTNVRKMAMSGKDQFDLFVKERLVDKTKSIYDVIPRNKLQLFGKSSTKNARKGTQKIASLINDVGLFSRMYISCQTREGNLDQFFRHENNSYPPSLSDNGSLRIGTKSDLLHCLDEFSATRQDAPAATCVILDGAAIIQMLKPTAVNNFGDYANQIFIPYLKYKLRDATRLDLVWDIYREDSLKSMARLKRGEGVRRRVSATAAIPRNWQGFLRVDENKTELFALLTQIVLAWFDKENKQLVVTDGEGIHSKPAQQDVALLAPCNHEEADSRMLLHTSHAAKHGHHKILIRTVDTDVVVLAVSMVHSLQPDDQLWLAFGTGANFRYFAAHEIAAGLGPEKSRALPMFHALTGCDNVSSFARHGKKGAWAVWTVLHDLTNALLKLSFAPTTIPEDALCCVERFTILLYDRTSTSIDINKTRKKMFSKNNNVNLIPPTRAALEQHVKRATYQGGHVWGQILLPTPNLPSPTSWGWIINGDGKYEPYWTALPKAADVCQELVFCKCKKGCTRTCMCKKATLPCTSLCVCEGECWQY